MRASAVAGIVFANTNDKTIDKLTINRTMASVPFGSRYRMVDFSLSNLVNAGVASVGIVTKENYRSLMDHVGNGVYWDLDRKNGGLYLLPPYLTSMIRKYSGTVDALYGALDYVNRCNADYMVLCNADTISNVDIQSAVRSHIENKADITVVYKNGEIPNNSHDTLVFDFDENNIVNGITLAEKCSGVGNYGLGIAIISRVLLIEIIKEAYEEGLVSVNRDLLLKHFDKYKMYGYLHEGFSAVMDDTTSYFNANMALLKSDARKQLFDKSRPIFTKTRDDMPTRYGINADVTNSLIADGCVINGTVKNSILFRGVVVEKGAVVENSILMQETSIGKSAQLDYVIADKNAVVGEEMIIKGTKENTFFIKKNQIC